MISAALNFLAAKNESLTASSSAHSAEYGHLTALKSVAGYFGIAPWEIDQLIEAGFTEAEIEEYLYQ